MWSSNLWPSERLEVALYTTPLFIQPPAGPHGLVSAHQRVQYTPTHAHGQRECIVLLWSLIYLFPVCSFGAVLYTETSELLGELQKSQRTAIICSVCVCVCGISGGVGRVDTIPTQSQREIPPKVFVAEWWEERGDFLKLRAGARANGFSLPSLTPSNEHRINERVRKSRPKTGGNTRFIDFPTALPHHVR